MSGIFKRIWIVTLAVSLAAWSQAEFCPMMLQGRAATCTRSTARDGQPAPSHHACCPRTEVSAKSHCANLRLRLGDHGMPCGSLDPPPASPSKVSTSSQQRVIVAVLQAFSATAPSQKRASADATGLLPRAPVFRLKEDLRV